jgi:hypothetical protein
MTRTTLAALLATCCLLTSCSDDASPRADERDGADFCTTYVEQVRTMATLDREDVASGVASAQDWASRMQDVELPDDVPEDARRGLDTMIRLFEELDADASWKEVQTLGDDLGTDARRDLAAMGDYVQSACADQVDEVLADLMDDRDGLQDQLDGMTESP